TLDSACQQAMTVNWSRTAFSRGSVVSKEPPFPTITAGLSWWGQSAASTRVARLLRAGWFIRLFLYPRGRELSRVANVNFKRRWAVMTASFIAVARSLGTESGISIRGDES